MSPVYKLQFEILATVAAWKLRFLPSHSNRCISLFWLPIRLKFGRHIFTLSYLTGAKYYNKRTIHVEDISILICLDLFETECIFFIHCMFFFCSLIPLVFFSFNSTHTQNYHVTAAMR